MERPNTKPYNLPSDAVWFITGCSSGIGQSLAQLVAKTSHRVVATARSLDSLSVIPAADNVLKLALDVTSASSIDAALGAALERFGRLDVLVNNAGYSLVGNTEAAGDADALFAVLEAAHDRAPRLRARRARERVLQRALRHHLDHEALAARRPAGGGVLLLRVEVVELDLVLRPSQRHCHR